MQGETVVLAERRAGVGPFVAVAAAVGVFAVSLGLSFPLLTLRLEAAGYGESAIGASAALQSLGYLAAAPLTPPLARRFGAWTLALASGLLLAGCFIALGAVEGFWAVGLLRVLLGTAGNTLYVLSETWVNALAAARTRGRLIGLYTTVMSLGFASGPLALPSLGDGWAPFLFGAAVTIVGVAPFLFVRRSLPRFSGEAPAAALGFIRHAPRLLCVVGLAALFDAAVLALLPVYGMARGLSEPAAVYALAALLGGNIGLQVPLGLLADRLPGRAVLILCLAGTALGGALLPLVALDSLWAWLLLVVWGGLAYGVYTAALIELGRRFQGALLLAGNAAFAGMWGIGALLGGPLAGGAIDRFGAEGMPIALALLFALALPVLSRRARPETP